MQRFNLRHVALFLAAGAVALAAGYFVGEYRQRAAEPAGAGTLVEFRLPDSEGRTRDADEWRGKPLIVNFWATWCAPCREEVPELVEAQREFGPRGLNVLGVAIDEPEPVRQFMEEMGFNYPSLVAETEGMELMARYGNTGALPFTVAFDAAGRVVGSKLGKVSREEIRTFVDAALR